MIKTRTILIIVLSFYPIFNYGQSYDTVLVKKLKVSSIKTYRHRLNMKPDKTFGSALYFDPHGNLIERYEKSYTTPVMKYKYDSNDHLIEKVNYKPDNTISEYFKQDYDSLGNIITDTTYFSWDNTKSIKHYLYDSKHRLIEMYEENPKNIKNYFSVLNIILMGS